MVAHRGHLLSYTPLMGILFLFCPHFPLPPGVSSLSKQNSCTQILVLESVYGEGALIILLVLLCPLPSPSSTSLGEVPSKSPLGLHTVDGVPRFGPQSQLFLASRAVLKLERLPSTPRLPLTVPYSRRILSPWMASKKAAQTIKMHGIYTEHRALF